MGTGSSASGTSGSLSSSVNTRPSVPLNRLYCHHEPSRDSASSQNSKRWRRPTKRGSNTFSGVDATVNSGTWTYSFPFGDFDDPPCATAGAEARCDLGTVPASGAGDLTVTATPTAAGLLTEQATASTDSTDPDVTNNAAATTVDVFRSVTIDIQPGDSTNVVQLKRGGLISVAILSTPQFNASTVDSATVCFGDAEAPAERTCAEVHGHGHLAEVNRDGRADMVLHYDVSATGIDLGDHSACLKGRTTAGVGIYGCDAVSPQ